MHGVSVPPDANLPRSFVLSDDAIVSLTKHLPKSAEAIKPMKGLTEKALQRNRGKIWEAIQQGIGVTCSNCLRALNGIQPDDGYEARVDGPRICQRPLPGCQD